MDFQFFSIARVENELAPLEYRVEPRIRPLLDNEGKQISKIEYNNCR